MRDEIRYSQDVPTLRISLVLHIFSRGGSDRVAAHLARGFADAGLDVEMVVFCRGGDVEDILSELAGRGIGVRYLGRTTGVRGLDLVLGLPRLVGVLSSTKPGAVISTANNMSLVTAASLLLSSNRKAALFLKTTNPIASSRHKGFRRRLRMWSYGLILEMTRAMWTLTPDETLEMRAAFPKHAARFRDVINPYVTPAMLRPATVAENHRREGKIVIAIARLTAQKRLDRLISAFAKVRDPNVRLLILGEGEERKALTAMIADLGLEERVQMPGYVADVASALHSADLFALTSDYEGLPAAVLEAMAANCPVICTACFPGAQRLLGQSEGCALLSDTSPEQIAATIERMLTRARPSDLREIAERYSIVNGVASHREALFSAF